MVLDQEEYTMVQYMNKNFGPDIEPLAKAMDRMLQIVLLYLRPLQIWINGFTSSRQAVAGDLLTRRLEELERRNYSLGGNENSLMSTLGKGFASNMRVPQTGTTSGVITMEAFVKLNATVGRLETQVQELKVAGVDLATQKLGGIMFTKLEWLVFYENGMKKMESEVQCCFTDALRLMVIVYQDNIDSTVRDSTSPQVIAQRAKFQGIESMVLKNSFARALLEAFRKHKVGQASRVALPAFLTYKTFDIQQSNSS